MSSGWIEEEGKETAEERWRRKEEKGEAEYISLEDVDSHRQRQTINIHTCLPDPEWRADCVVSSTCKLNILPFTTTKSSAHWNLCPSLVLRMKQAYLCSSWPSSPLLSGFRDTACLSCPTINTSWWQMRNHRGASGNPDTSSKLPQNRPSTFNNVETSVLGTSFAWGTPSELKA